MAVDCCAHCEPVREICLTLEIPVSYASNTRVDEAGFI